MTIFRFSLLAAALLISSCSDRISDEDLVCDPSPGLIGKPPGSGPETVFEKEGEVFQCIHKWGYRFGRASGSNSEIASAVIGKCGTSISQLQALRNREGIASNQPLTVEAWQASVENFRENALTRVVEGRAGNCSIRGEDQK